jgi:hypothetical protein
MRFLIEEKSHERAETYKGLFFGLARLRRT